MNLMIRGPGPESTAPGHPRVQPALALELVEVVAPVRTRAAEECCAARDVQRGAIAGPLESASPMRGEALHLPGPRRRPEEQRRARGQGVRRRPADPGRWGEPGIPFRRPLPAERRPD